MQHLPVIADAVVLRQPRQGVDLLIERQSSLIFRKQAGEDVDAAFPIAFAGMQPEAETAIGADRAEGLPLVSHPGHGGMQKAILAGELIGRGEAIDQARQGGHFLQIALLLHRQALDVEGGAVIAGKVID